MCEKEKISIIIPVYNVGKYVDRCLKSVCTQTYDDLEIIIINDGSTDNSYQKCKEWEEKDNRICLYSQDNHGLGYTRNRGVKLASGDYIMFVDSDDWVEPTIVEELFGMLISTDSDVSLCDRFQVKEQTGEREYIANTIDDIVNVQEQRSCIYNVTTSAWGKIYRKELIIDNEIFEPEHCYEDAATPVIIALSERICRVRKGLYNYVYDRAGSIINSSSTTVDLEKYINFVINEFKKRGLFETFKEELQQLVEKRISWSLVNARKNVESDMKQLYDNCNEICLKTFGTEYSRTDMSYLKDCFFIYGSYNLMIAAKRVMRMNSSAFPTAHICFSSLIATMDEDKNSEVNQYTVVNSNKFRRYHLINEFRRDFLKKNKGEFVDIKYMVIDFLEERFSVAECGDHFITMSDALMVPENETIIKNACILMPEKRNLQWKKACDKFIDKIKQYNSQMKIILVKMKLSERFGNEKGYQFFEKIDDIKATNKRLEEMYTYFVEKCPNAVVIDVANDRDYYTDENFKHGCFPWHLNQFMYKKIQEKIECVVFEEA